MDEKVVEANCPCTSNYQGPNQDLMGDIQTRVFVPMTLQAFGVLPLTVSTNDTRRCKATLLHVTCSFQQLKKGLLTAV